MNYTHVLDTQHQLKIADVLFEAVGGGELADLLPILPSPLLAADHLSNAISTALPDNQWILEVTNCKPYLFIISL